MEAPKCPNCGEETLAVNVDSEVSVRCSNCEETFSTADLRAASDKLLALVQWVEQAPFKKA